MRKILYQRLESVVLPSLNSTYEREEAWLAATALLALIISCDPQPNAKLRATVFALRDALEHAPGPPGDDG